MIHGASGGVGTAAVQIARAMGLTVLGTAGTPHGLDLAKQEGAHEVFDHRKSGYQEEILRATSGRGVDIILEMLANVNLAHDTKLLTNNGRVIVIGSLLFQSLYRDPMQHPPKLPVFCSGWEQSFSTGLIVLLALRPSKHNCIVAVKTTLYRVLLTAFFRNTEPGM